MLIGMRHDAIDVDHYFRVIMMQNFRSITASLDQDGCFITVCGLEQLRG